MMMAISSPVQVTSPSRRRFAEALRTRDRTASSIGSEGLVCPPIEPTSALMTESVTLLMAGLLVQIAGSLYIPLKLLIEDDYNTSTGLKYFLLSWNIYRLGPMR